MANKIKFSVQCMALYKGEIALPEEVQTKEDALAYVRAHLDDVPVADLEWLSDIEPEQAVTEEDIRYFGSDEPVSVATKEQSLSERADALYHDLVDYCREHEYGARIYRGDTCTITDDCCDSAVEIEDRASNHFNVSDDTVAMSFEGVLYDLLNYGALPSFEAVFERHGFYYEQESSWNLVAVDNM